MELFLKNNKTNPLLKTWRLILIMISLNSVFIAVCFFCPLNDFNAFSIESFYSVVRLVEDLAYDKLGRIVESYP